MGYFEDAALELTGTPLRQKVQKSIVSKGDFIVCKSCRFGDTEEKILCKACGEWLPEKVFLDVADKAGTTCVKCPRGRHNTRKTFLCTGHCGHSLLAWELEPTHLFKCLLLDQPLALTCIDCNDATLAEFKDKTFTCMRCKHVKSFSAFEKTQRHLIKRSSSKITCSQCTHPQCKRCGVSNPGNAYCSQCRHRGHEYHYLCSQCGDVGKLEDFPETVHCHILAAKKK